jgi:hypothetical protein
VRLAADAIARCAGVSSSWALDGATSSQVLLTTCAQVLGSGWSLPTASWLAQLSPLQRAWLANPLRGPELDPRSTFHAAAKHMAPRQQAARSHSVLMPWSMIVRNGEQPSIAGPDGAPTEDPDNGAVLRCVRAGAATLPPARRSSCED